MQIFCLFFCVLCELGGKITAKVTQRTHDLFDRKHFNATPIFIVWLFASQKMARKSLKEASFSKKSYIFVWSFIMINNISNEYKTISCCRLYNRLSFRV